MTNDEFACLYSESRRFIEEGIERFCSAPVPTIPRRLREAMSYSLTAGGKRLRPVLCIKAGEIFGLPREKSLPMAIALEMIHTASLIHDDLPSMDDDVLRRGKPTNHVLYGEALAILAGDALMACAFEYPLLSLPDLGTPLDRICTAMFFLANALGPSGICGGQVLDIDRESMDDSPDYPWRVAKQKTAALIRASVIIGATLAGADNVSLKAFESFGEHLGMAFQIMDDILDVTATTYELGKTPGKDAEHQKKTFVALYGVEQAKKLATEENEKAMRALENVKGDVSFFSTLTRSMCGRTK